MSSRSTKGENVSRGMGLGVMNGYWGVFEMQQNKSGGFSPGSGGKGQTSCRQVPARYRCGTSCRSAPGLLCPQALTVAERHTKKPHAFA